MNLNDKIEVKKASLIVLVIISLFSGMMFQQNMTEKMTDLQIQQAGYERVMNLTCYYKNGSDERFYSLFDNKLGSINYGK